MPKPQKVDSKNVMRVIVVLARSHPGESVTSFVCQGFLEFLLSSHPIAVILRENFVFKIIPMINPDGVFLGNNRCNLIGQDLNRAWNIATEFSHPTILAAKNMLKELDASEVILIFEPNFHFTNTNTIFSAINWTLFLTYMHTPLRMVRLFMEIRTRMCIVMRGI